MKKMLVWFLVCCMMMPVSACGGGSTGAETNNTVNPQEESVDETAEVAGSELSEESSPEEEDANTTTESEVASETKWYEADPLKLNNAEFTEETIEKTMGIFRYDVPQSWIEDTSAETYIQYSPIEGDTSVGFATSYVEYPDIPEDAFDVASDTDHYELLDKVISDTFSDAYDRTEKMPCLINGRRCAIVGATYTPENSEKAGEVYVGFVPAKNQVITVMYILANEEYTTGSEEFGALLNSIQVIDPEEEAAKKAEEEAAKKAEEEAAKKAEEEAAKKAEEEAAKKAEEEAAKKAEEEAAKKAEEEAAKKAEEEAAKKAEEEAARKAEEEANRTLTVDNCEELKNILSMKASLDPAYEEFAEKYKGRKIEFDGRIDYLVNHGSFTTRWDFLLSAGDYDPDHMTGPTFKFENVNMYDLNTDLDEIRVGQNVHIVATVEEFNSNQEIMFITPVAVTGR